MIIIAARVEVEAPPSQLNIQASIRTSTVLSQTPVLSHLQQQRRRLVAQAFESHDWLYSYPILVMCVQVSVKLCQHKSETQLRYGMDPPGREHVTTTKYSMNFE